MPLIEEIPNNIVQNEYIKLVAEKINVDEKALIREVNKTKNYKTQAVSEVPRIVTKSSNIYEKAQKNLLSLFLIGEGNPDVRYLSEIIKNDVKHDFLMIPDNGTWDAKTEDLLNAVSPMYAAITCSEKNPASAKVAK